MSEPITREEQYLNRIANGSGTLPESPLTREEQYLAKIAGEEVTIPEKPVTRKEQYLDKIANTEPTPGITVTELSATENKTYTAPEGYAYSPVTVNVPANVTTKSITSNGTYRASADNVISKANHLISR